MKKKTTKNKPEKADQKLASRHKPDAKKKMPEPEEKTDDSLDFGGLPSRDFKKNLGCG